MAGPVVWHRADLRTTDNAALAAAAGAGSGADADDREGSAAVDGPAADIDRLGGNSDDGPPVPVFVVEPRYWTGGLACDARLSFLLESLSDLRRQYRSLGGDLLVLHDADPVGRLAALADRLDTTVYFNRSATAGPARERDDAVCERPWSRGFTDDGLVAAEGFAPDGRPASRVGWDDQVEAYVTAEPHPRPDALAAPPVDGDTTVRTVRERYGVDPDKRDVPAGGTVAGRERLSSFTDRVASYPDVVSDPAAAEDGTSRLSPYLAFGCLSVREVHRAVAATPAGRGRSTFLDRLYWNRHYNQKLLDWPGYLERALNPVFRGLYGDPHDPELVAAWREGRTGFPLVDAAMRALVETGFVNFRMRAMIASVYGHLLAQPWKAGADFLYHHLVDADPGVNYTQWQAQTNLTGAHPVRVYDPAKQLREHDPDGEYVRRYVPELRAVPDEHLPRPDRMPKPLQREVGVEIGEDYPVPVVDYDAAAAAARDRHDRLADRAQAAFDDPELRRRASLSNRRLLDDGDEEEPPDDQARLDEF